MLIKNYLDVGATKFDKEHQQELHKLFNFCTHALTPFSEDNLKWATESIVEIEGEVDDMIKQSETTGTDR